MVMIPVDVGVQVRNQTEGGSNPVRALGSISPELQDFQQGQAFRARIQEVLPENTYKALVAGRLLTLSLPEGAKAGDTLDLVVVGHTRQAIVAQRGDASANPAIAPFENASLSRAGQLIASLLAPEGEPLPPASLSGGPILAKVPANAAEIARELPPRLSRALAGSGMFYESHQAEWALGQRPLASLLAEPQGRLSQPALLRWAAAGGDETAPPAPGETATTTPSPRDLQQAIAARGPLAAGQADAELPAATERLSAIPEELRPLVQQQLEAGASNRLVWQGQVWPNQLMDWEIRRDQSGAGEPNEPQDLWQTRLHLSLPRLGEIDIRLQLSGEMANVMLEATAAASGASLEAEPASRRRSRGCSNHSPRPA